MVIWSIKLPCYSCTVNLSYLTWALLKGGGLRERFWWYRYPVWLFKYNMIICFLPTNFILHNFPSCVTIHFAHPCWLSRDIPRRILQAKDFLFSFLNFDESVQIKIFWFSENALFLSTSVDYQPQVNLRDFSEVFRSRSSVCGFQGKRFVEMNARVDYASLMTRQFMSKAGWTLPGTMKTFCKL